MRSNEGVDLGRVCIGSYDPGESSEAWWQLWAGADRLAHGVIVGDPDSGALDVLGAVGLGARRQGVEVWFVDPACGASSSVLAAVANRVIPFQPGGRLLEELEGELLDRCRAAVELRDPDSPEARCPLLVTVAEGEEVFDDYLIRRVFEKVVRYGGRVGMGVALVVRSSSLVAFGGGAGLRHALLAQNVVSAYDPAADLLDDEPLPWMEDVDIELAHSLGFVAYRGQLERVMPFWIADPALSLSVGFSARDCAQQSGPGVQAGAATGRTPERRSDP